MATLLNLLSLFALEGQWADFRAIVVVVIAVIMLPGSIYMLLASNFGARLGYLITMVSLSGFVIILSIMWLVGAPGTTASTGPRGPEPSWIPFTAESEQGKDLRRVLSTYPDGWDPIVSEDAEGTLVSVKYPGNLDSRGDFEQVRTSVTEALARAAERDAEKLPPAEAATALKKPANWMFRAAAIPPATPDERDLPAADVRYYFEGTRLFFGATIPAVTADDCVRADGSKITNCKPHPEITVFAFRDKGKVYLQALMFLIVSLLVFFSHLMLLGRYEAKQKAEEAAMTPEPVNA
jgi:hypothetical protein